MKLNVKKYSQRDENYGGYKMGKSDVKIRDCGCLMTCISMVNTYFGKPMPPRQLNDVMARAGGYSYKKEGNTTYAYVNWGWVAQQFDYKFGGIESFKNIPAPVNELIERLRQGLPTIVKLDADKVKTGIQSHFVVVTGYDELAKDFIVNDPLSLPAQEFYLGKAYPHKNLKFNKPKYTIYGFRKLTPAWDWKPQSDNNNSNGEALTECLKAHSHLMNELNKKDSLMQELREQLAKTSNRLESSKSIRKSLIEDNKQLEREIGNIERERGRWRSTAEIAKGEIAKLERKIIESEDNRKENKARYEKILAFDIRKMSSVEILLDLIRKIRGKELVGRNDKKNR